MSRHFFSGGLMPSTDLPARFQDDLRLQETWLWSGTHYAKTAEAWLHNMDQHRTAIVPTLEHVYGSDDSYLWWTRWRIFFMSVAELFGYDNGEEWQVGHFLFSKR